MRLPMDLRRAEFVANTVANVATDLAGGPTPTSESRGGPGRRE
jgi:hypothetical protein